MAEVRETIYLKADRNIEVTKPEVTIGDVMKVECVNPTVLAKVRSMRLLKFGDGAGGKTDVKSDGKSNGKSQGMKRIAVSVMKVIACIHEVYPKAEIQNMGEADFIVTFEKQKTTGGWGHLLKAVAVVLISFTGAAFSIMTFNNDVDVKKIFSQVYELTTGMKSDGFTVIELTYSIGIVIGILVFFNHFGKKRFTVDPTPIEVEMRLYENDLQTTLIEDYSRKEQELDVGR